MWIGHQETLQPNIKASADFMSGDEPKIWLRLSENLSLSMTPNEAQQVYATLGTAIQVVAAAAKAAQA